MLRQLILFVLILLLLSPPCFARGTQSKTIGTIPEEILQISLERLESVDNFLNFQKINPTWRRVIQRSPLFESAKLFKQVERKIYQTLALIESEDDPEEQGKHLRNLYEIFSTLEFAYAPDRFSENQKLFFRMSRPSLVQITDDVLEKIHRLPDFFNTYNFFFVRASWLSLEQMKTLIFLSKYDKKDNPNKSLHKRTMREDLVRNPSFPSCFIKTLAQTTPTSAEYIEFSILRETARNRNTSSQKLQEIWFLICNKDDFDSDMLWGALAENPALPEGIIEELMKRTRILQNDPNWNLISSLARNPKLSHLSATQFLEVIAEGKIGVMEHQTLCHLLIYNRSLNENHFKKIFEIAEKTDNLQSKNRLYFHLAYHPNTPDFIRKKIKEYHEKLDDKFEKLLLSIGLMMGI